MKREWMIEKRMDKELNQTELAKLCNVSAQTISNIENGRRTPSAWLALKISDVLDFSMARFYTDEFEKVESH